MYDGSIRAADAEIGRILEKLSELGLEEDTLVVFLSDHGPGDVALAHAANEWLPLDELVQAAEVLTLLIARKLDA